MAEYLTIDTELWASKRPESAYNTSPTLGADFEPLVSLQPFWLLPEVGKITNAGRVGVGSEFPTNQCNDYWSHPALALSNDQELFGIYGRLWLRAFGGAVVITDAAPGKRHSAKLLTKAEGRQLPSTSMIVHGGPDEILLAGMVVESAQLSKERTGFPTLAFNLLGSGKHAFAHGIGSLPGYSAPGVCALAADLVAQYTKEDSTVVDLSAEAGCRFRAFNIALGNNLKTDDRCPGDTVLTQNGGSAPYVRKLLRQARTLTIEMTFVSDDNHIEYPQYVANDIITDVDVAIQGAVIGIGPAQYQLGVHLEKAVFSLVRAIDSEGDAAYTATFQPLFDSVSDAAAVGYVQNDTLTAFD